MPLTLTVINYQDRATEHSTKTIDHDPLTIGRATDNDWVLPDPEMVLSRRHCIIERRDDTYLLTDTSVNGVFINHSEERVGKNNSAVLNDGDTLALGQYVIQVSITPELGSTDLYPALETDLSSTASNDVLTDPIKPPSATADDDLIDDAFATSASDDIEGSIDSVAEDSGRSIPAIPTDEEAESQQPSAEPDHITDQFNINIASDSHNNDNVDSQPPPFTPAGTMIATALPENAVESQAVPAATEHLPSAASTAAETTDSEQLSAAEKQEHTERIRLAEQPENQLQEPIPKADITPVTTPENVTSTIADSDKVAPAPEQPAATQIEQAAPQSEIEQAAPRNEIEQATPESEIEQAAPQNEAATHAEPNTPPSATQQDNDFSDSDALQALLRGAELDNLALAPEQMPELMYNVGVLLKQTATGLREVLIARSSIRNEMRVADRTLVGMTMNPLKALPNVEQILHALLDQQNNGWMPAADAIGEGFDDIKAHEQAMVAGIQAMLETLLAELDPQQIEGQLGDSSKLDVLSGGRKGKCWEAFKQRHQKLAQDIETDTKGVFGQALAQAYEKQQREFKPQQ